MAASSEPVCFSLKDPGGGFECVLIKRRCPLAVVPRTRLMNISPTDRLEVYGDQGLALDDRSSCSQHRLVVARRKEQDLQTASDARTNHLC